eukprot:tig00020614_g12189.t1
MDQDWEPVVIRKKPAAGASGSKLSDERAVAVARSQGAEVETLKKFAAGSNKKTATPNASKLDAETEELHHDTVPRTLALEIQKGRQAKKWTQKQLAQAMSEREDVVKDYENGKAIPNVQMIVKFERALGIRLPRPQKAKAKATE